MLDVVIVSSAWLILAGVNAWPVLGYGPKDDGLPTTGSVIAFTFVLIAICVAYFIIGELLGRTIGKRFVGLRVVRGSSWRRPGLSVGTLRALSKLVTIASLGIGYVAMERDHERRSLHDHIARTFVIHAE
jgi:uncharacterized RDD family membrane protein YckC